MDKTTQNQTRITAEQLAAVLNISEFTVKKLKKEIPHEYIKGKLLFNTEKLLAFFSMIEGGAA